MTKNYTMEQINNFLYDALNDEDLNAQEIYETIIETVAEHTEYLQLQYEKSQQVFDLLKGTAKLYDAPWDKFIADNNQRESKLPKQNKVKSWVLPVDEDGVITLPEELLEQTGWKEGDTLVYEISDGGVIVRRKEPMTHTEMIEKGYTMTADGFWIMDMDAWGINNCYQTGTQTP
jgi:bifunctional DNA-binding transcriptional regulator/antitoxin component of YhaV-PrlF toxin-antitoxin module